MQVIGSNAAEGVTGGEDGGTTGRRVQQVGRPRRDSGPTAARSRLTGGTADMLLNLNSGLLTDNDADVWVVNQNPACAPGGAGAVLSRASARSWRIVRWDVGVAAG